jgi:alpha-amylase
MHVGTQHAGEQWTDLMAWAWGHVAIDRDGWGVFPVGPRSVGVWADEHAEGRESIETRTREL